ncbi:hypothetical protein Tco_0422084 [Tanacetum coccineum]
MINPPSLTYTKLQRLGTLPRRIVKLRFAITAHHKLKGLKIQLKLWYSRTKEAEYSRKKSIISSLKSIEENIDAGCANDEVRALRVNRLQELDGLEKLESMDLAQKARVKWEVEGDENSKFSHDISNSRMKSQMIQDRNSLESMVSLEEIRAAIWDCGSQKASGPDGFSFMFIKKFWDLMNHDIQTFVVNFFTPGSISSQEQSAFISGHQILDGPLILSEVIDWFEYGSLETDSQEKEQKESQKQTNPSTGWKGQSQKSSQMKKGVVFQLFPHKDCLKSYEALQKQYDQQREALNKSNLEIIGYQMGLESLEKNEAFNKENIKILKYDVQVKDISIKDLKNQLEEALKEKDDLKKIEESLKNLTKLINSQISAKEKTGLGYDG